MFSVIRQAFTDKPGDGANRSYFPIVFIFVLIFFVVRAPYQLIYPLMFVEDGAVIFPYYYSNLSAAGLLRNFAGHVSIYQNIIGYIGSLFPVQVVPYLYSTSALLLSVTTFSFFSTRFFRNIVANDAIRAVICLFLAFVPIGNFALIYGLAFTGWNSGVLMGLMCLISAPRDRLGITFIMGLSAIAIWSSPLTIIVIPVIVYRIVRARNRHNQCLFAGLFMLAVSYLILGIDYQQPSYAGKIGVDTAISVFRNITVRILVEALLGPLDRIPNLGQVFANKQYAIELIAVCGVGLIVVSCAAFSCFVSGLSVVRRLNFWLGLGYFIVAPTVMITVTRGSIVYSGAWGHRYLYMQSIAFLIGIACLMWGPIMRVRPKLVSVTVVCIFLFYLNQYRFDQRGIFHRSHPNQIAQGKELAKFFQVVQETTDAGHKVTGLRLERVPRRWSIQIP